MASATTERIYKLTVDATAAVNKLDQIAKSTGAVEQKMTKAGSAMEMAFKGVAAAGALVGVIASMKKFVDYADQLADTADAFGTSATAISAWGGAIQQAGGNAEKTQQMFQKTSDLIAQIVDDKAPDSVKKLGIAFTDIKGLNVEETFDLIVQRLAKIKDNAERSATAFDIFGKAALGVDFKKLADDAALLDKNIGDFEVNIRAAADAADYLADIFKKAMGFGAAMVGSFANDINRFKAMVDQGKWIPLEQWNKDIADSIKKGAEESKASLDKLRTAQNNSAKFENGAKERNAEQEKLNAAIAKTVEQQIAWEAAMLDSLNPMREIDRELAKLQVALDSGRISWDQYADGMFKITEKIDGLKKVKEPLDEIGVAIGNTLASGVSSLIDSFDQAGASFGKMAADFLKNIAKMIAQMFILKAIQNSMKGTAAGAFFGFAKGGDFSGGTGLPHGVYDQPTFFKFANGGTFGSRTGVLGEAGAEVIAPLKRNAQGQMGVQAAPSTVNVYNSAGADVKTQESTGSDGSRTIDIYIEKKIKDSIANGTLDKAFRSSFGLTRSAA